MNGGEGCDSGPSSGTGEETGNIGGTGGTKRKLAISLCFLGHSAGGNEDPVRRELPGMCLLASERSVGIAARCSR